MSLKPKVMMKKYIRKIKTHSSCDIEDFVETHLCNLCCDTPIARIAGCVLSLRIHSSGKIYT